DSRQEETLGDRRTNDPSDWLHREHRCKKDDREGLWLDEDHRNFRRTRWRGLAKTRLAAIFVSAAYNLTRIARLSPTATCPTSCPGRVLGVLHRLEASATDEVPRCGSGTGTGTGTGTEQSAEKRSAFFRSLLGDEEVEEDDAFGVELDELGLAVLVGV